MREVTIVSCKTPHAGICKRLAKGVSNVGLCEVRYQRRTEACAIARALSTTRQRVRAGFTRSARWNRSTAADGVGQASQRPGSRRAEAKSFKKSAAWAPSTTR